MLQIEVLPTVVTVKWAQFLQSDSQLNGTLHWSWCSANNSKPECCMRFIKGMRRVTNRINCKKHEFSRAEMKKKGQVQRDAWCQSVPVCNSVCVVLDTSRRKGRREGRNKAV